MGKARVSLAIKILTVIDEFTRKCPAMVVERRLVSDDVLFCLSDLLLEHGIPNHIRFDNCLEFTDNGVSRWLFRIGAKTLIIDPGAYRRMSICNVKLVDENANGESFYTLKEA